MSSSASPPARASERLPARSALHGALLSLCLAIAWPAASMGQTPVPPPPPEPSTGALLVVDMDAALRESAASRALREAEIGAREALQRSFDAVQADLEAEEARMVRLRQTTPRAEFDKLVVAFDQKVRAARRDAQQAGAALQARFAEAQSALAAIARPLLNELMAERGAALVISRKSTLAVAPQLDVTGALLERLNRRQPDAEGLIPPQPQPAPDAATSD